MYMFHAFRFPRMFQRGSMPSTDSFLKSLVERVQNNFEETMHGKRVGFNDTSESSGKYCAFFSLTMSANLFFICSPEMHLVLFVLQQQGIVLTAEARTAYDEKAAGNTKCSM